MTDQYDEIAARAIGYLQQQVATALGPPVPTILADILRGGAVVVPQEIGFTPSADTRMIHVSESGDDANDWAAGEPLRTLAYAKSFMRDGFPDWLLLKCGDTWEEGLERWTLSGRSATEPMLIGTYGDGPRPILLTGLNGMIRSHVSDGDNPGEPLRHIVIVGLHSKAHTYDGTNGSPSGISWLHHTEDLLIEDCVLERHAGGITMQAWPSTTRHRDIKIERTIVIDCFSAAGSGNGQGAYCEGIDGLLITECVFDDSGWMDPSVFRHNLYIQNGCTDVTIERNCISNASSHGIQLRCGGVLVDNLIAGNSIGALVGGGSTPEPAGVRADIHRNAIVLGKNIDPANERGWGLDLANISSGDVTENVIAHVLPGTQKDRAFNVNGTGNGLGIGVHNLTGTGNIIHKWGKPKVLVMHNPDDQVDPLPPDLIAPTGDYPSPDRALTVPAMIEEMRSRERGSWDEATSPASVSSWIRDGFLAQ